MKKRKRRRRKEEAESKRSRHSFIIIIVTIKAMLSLGFSHVSLLPFVFWSKGQGPLCHTTVCSLQVVQKVDLTISSAQV